VQYKHAIADGLEAIEQLGQQLTERKDELIRAATQALEQECNKVQVWLKQNQPRGDEGNDDRATENVEFSSDPDTLEDSIASFCRSLPIRYSKCAELGMVIYRAIHGQTSKAGNWADAHLRLPRLLSEVVQLENRLGDLRLNITEAAFNQRSSRDHKGPYYIGDYSGWVRMEVEKLDAAIIDRLLLPESIQAEQQVWISATEAAALSQSSAHPLSLPDVSKWARKRAFLYRNPSKSRLEVEIVSFRAWLQTQAKSDKEPTTEAERQGIEDRKQQAGAAKRQGRSDLA
jgi:hypothetical protein